MNSRPPAAGLAVALTAAIALAGCSPTAPKVPTLSPGASATIAALGPTATPGVATPASTELPGCDEVGQVIKEDFDPPILPGEFDTFFRWPSVGFVVSSATEIDDEDAVWSGVPSDEPRHEPGWMPGGVDVALRLGDEDDRASAAWAPRLTAATVLFVGIDGVPQPMASRIDDRADGTRWLVIEVPDVDGQGNVVIDAAWRDRCLAYEGSASLDVAIVPARLAAGCPEDVDAARPLLDSIFQPAPMLGDFAMAPLIVGADWFWVTGAFADDLATPFADWTPDTPTLRPRAGELLTYRGTNPEVRLTGFAVDYYRRSDAVDQPFSNPAPIDRRAPAVQLNGTVRVRMPDALGRYVAVFHIGWETATPCMSGTAIAAYSVDVEE